MKIRVAYIITPTFGSTWSGITHSMFSLLSGWHEEEISLDLLGTQLKVLNSNSGDRAYKLSGPIWQSPHHRMTSFERLLWTLQIIWLLITKGRKYDIFHFMTINWGGTLSPLVLHPFGKKAVFSMVRYGVDNPSDLARTFRGRVTVNLLRRFDGIIGLSPALVEDCKRHHFTNKLLTLPLFLTVGQLEGGKSEEMGKIARSQLKIPDDALVLFFMGSDHKRKGLDILVDSFQKLAATHPELWLVIVGPTSKADHTSVDESFLEIQKKKIEQARLQDRVVWTGMIRDTDLLAHYYSAANIVVLPTRGEGLPNVIIESMFAGLPIVISHLPGITDSIICHGENGFLVKVDDTEGFVNSIDMLICRPDLRESMGKSNRKKAHDLLSFESYCQKLREFYIDVVNS